MCCPRWALLLLCCIVDLTSSRPIPDDRSAEASVEETRHRRQIFFGGPPPFGPPRMGPLPPQPFPPPPFGYHGHLMRPPYFPPPLPPVVPPIGPMPAPVMMPPPQPMPTIVFGPQQLEPLEPEEPAPLPQPIPRPRPTPAPRPPRPTFSSSTFLSHPEVKKFIAEISRHTTAFNKPNQGYDRVLLLMQRYFTRRSRTRTEYDGTLIRPTIFGSNDELVANRKITGNLFENDMALTVPQMLIASRSPGGRYRRKIIADSTHHWRGARIPYYFGSADRSWQQRIRNALDYFERETCLRFVEDSRAEDFIYFLRGSGCFSAIGKLGGSQPISIGTGCESLGIISHEVGHSLGFVHEQERPERDYYVRINLQYAIPGTEGNFDKRPPGALIDLGIPYDLGSVMHYASTAFAYESLRHTVDPVDTKYRSTVGNRVAPSFTDIKQINHLYCSDRCTTTVNTCQNGGYPDPNNCTRCKCPQGLAGSTCTDLEYAICGGELQATFSWQELNHSVSGQCYWRISAYPGGRVRFQVTDVFFKCGPTCEEFIEIKYLADMQVTGFRLCCYPEGGTILSRGPYILVIIRAVAPSRFALRYISEGGTEIAVSPHQSFESVWGNWNAWSECSERCGACGVRLRRRTCAGRLCKQQFETQSQQCNMRACEPGATLRLARTGRVLRRGLRRSINDHASEWCCERYVTRNGWCYPVA
ncbi:Zinc metalloproteinase nas-33 [Toxocara canis]|uniref:Metalloendopeptidase n=1 Tax=Toxocara canis TaxID=6265 RepID=A0A0B2V0F3_TOXCA|nr:Zinc metalloproteinase nas-33 [Toxocara canis]